MPSKHPQLRSYDPYHTAPGAHNHNNVSDHDCYARKPPLIQPDASPRDNLPQCPTHHTCQISFPNHMADLQIFRNMHWGTNLSEPRLCKTSPHKLFSYIFASLFTQALTSPHAPDIYPSLARLPTNQIAAIFVVMTTFTSNHTSQCFPAMF